jgi:hypothetical protein
VAIMMIHFHPDYHDDNYHVGIIILSLG